MMDTLHTEEDSKVYLENMRWNRKRFVRTAVLYPNIITDLHKMESSKDCINARIAVVGLS